MSKKQIEDFIEATGTTMKCNYLGFGEHDEFKAPDPRHKWNAYNWRVQVRRGKKAFSVNYHMGSGLPGEPQLTDVLFNLMSDALDAREASDLHEFAAEYVLPLDEPKEIAYAKRLYNACLKNMKQLEHLYAFYELDVLEEAIQDY